jgi:nucleotide-binding universal stress UspA family protein
MTPVFTHLLCPVDFSPDSERAVSVALALATKTSAHVTLLTVVDPLLRAGADAAGAAHELDRQTEVEVKTLLDRVAREASGAVMPAIAVACGDPAVEILRQAREAKADAIVMGMRGIGGATKLFLGSVSEAVLKRSPIPVVVVPPLDRR